jgi:membrane protein YqaA with SNARE-associated domain
MIEVFWTYIQVSLVSFLLNIVPAFAPPTWIVLGLYKISYQGMNIFLLALFGVIGSVFGRLIMYYYSGALKKYLPKQNKTHLNYLRKIEKGKKLQLFIITFFYSLSPLPSNFLFITAGLSGFEILPLIAGFTFGRIASYSLLIYGEFRMAVFLERFGIGHISFIADIVGILASIMIVLIDWKKVYERYKKFKVFRKKSKSQMPEGF